MTFSKKLMRDIEKFYNNEQYSHQMHQFKSVSEKEYSDLYSEGFTESTPLSKKDENGRKVLDGFVKAFQEAKLSYLTRKTAPNLVSFFDKNTLNLKGIFNSCIQNFYETTK